MAAVAADSPVETKRLFISGISPSLTTEELSKRLQGYGQLTDGLILNKKNADTTGIFGHCGLALNAAAWSKLRKLSGTVLKGSKLRIEEAKLDWQVKKALDQERPQPPAPNPRKRPAPGTISAVESRRVKRGEVVKDSSITQKSRKQGWIKGRYGRAIAILKTADGVKLPRNPDALSRLWGSAHPKADQLTYFYDEEEEQWHDRRGRVIKEVEVSKKKPVTEFRQGGRVEVWNSGDEMDDDLDGRNVPGEHSIDYVPATDEGQPTESLNEEEIDAQLQKERFAGMSLLEDMFKDAKQETSMNVHKQEQRKEKDKLNIIQRFDPTAPEDDSESDDDVSAHAAIAEESADEDASKLVTEAEATQHIHTAPLDEDDEDDEDEPLPAFLKKQSAKVNTADLTSIFKPRLQAEDASFRFSAADDEEEEEEEEEENDDPQAEAANVNGKRDADTLMPDVMHDTQGIHPDRLNRTLVESENQLGDQEENANYTVLAKDRGFNLTGAALKLDPTPAFFLTGPGTLWGTQCGLFSAVLDHEAIKARLEATRAEATRDWKRKEREGNKQMRKATNRHG